MEREELENLEVCLQCGATVEPRKERSFEFGIGNLLCWSCALERGGRFDAMLDLFGSAR